MKKHKIDILIVVILLLIAGIGWLSINCFYNDEPGEVQVLIDGELTEEYSLNDEGEYEIITGDQINIIKINRGHVYMIEADCPDQLCIKQGKISKNGQSIICLPNKIVVTIVSDDLDEVDAYAK